MIAGFIDSHDTRWTTFLRGTRHDCYHLPEYVELAAEEEGARPAAFYAEQGSAGCLIPLLIRPMPGTLHAPAEWLDCVSPYGYAGILLSSPEEKLDSFLEAFCSAARTRGIVSAFLRLHPLFPLDYGALGKFGRLIWHGQTVYINVAESMPHLWRQMSTNHKRNIEKLRRSGFQCTLDRWERFPDFIALYHATMRRVNAPRAYFFSPRYFEALREKLGSRLHLVCVLSHAEEVAAAGLFLETDGIVQYHLGGTAEKYLALAPSKLMMDCVRCWAHDMSYGVLHLGGGVGGAEDSLFRFKAGFSAARAEFYTYRMVIDESKYEALSRAAQRARGPGPPGSGGFFPPYRDL